MTRLLKRGSKIHIKKTNVGKFTEYCDGKVTNECILKAKKSNSPTLRKRAVFAENARKWNKKDKLVPKATWGTALSVVMPIIKKLGTKLVLKSASEGAGDNTGAGNKTEAEQTAEKALALASTTQNISTAFKDSVGAGIKQALENVNRRALEFNDQVNALNLATLNYWASRTNLLNANRLNLSNMTFGVLGSGANVHQENPMFSGLGTIESRRTAQVVKPSGFLLGAINVASVGLDFATNVTANAAQEAQERAQKEKDKQAADAAANLQQTGQAALVGAGLTDPNSGTSKVGTTAADNSVTVGRQ